MLRGSLQYLKRHHVALLALFVVLGGSAYAVGRGKIGSKRIKTNAVKERHIAPDAVSDSEANEKGFGLIRTPRITVNDAAGGSFTERPIATYGPFTVISRCTDQGGNALIQVLVRSSQRAYIDLAGASNDVIDAGNTASLTVGGLETGTNSAISAGAVLGTTSGRAMSFSVHGVAKPASDPDADCSFQVLGIGR